MAAAQGSGTARVHRILQDIYMGTAVLGALAFVGIEVLVLYQLGGQFLLYIPRSADEFAGYCMAASAFLSLAYTLNANEHIRVTLISERLGPVTRGIVDRVAISIAVVLAAFLGWHVTKMAWQTWLFDERSAGQIPLPLWIPQAAMAVGAVAFVVAVAQRAVRVWRGGSIELPMQGEGGHRADR
jgi:TRAP-type C4-dicarboxylate transport system permease small subunit